MPLHQEVTTLSGMVSPVDLSFSSVAKDAMVSLSFVFLVEASKPSLHEQTATKQIVVVLPTIVVLLQSAFSAGLTA